MKPRGCFLLTAALLCIANARTTQQQDVSATDIVVHAQRPLYVTHASYVGVNIDSASLYNRMDFTDANLIAVMRNLSPMVLRIGGGTADSLVFSPNPPTGNNSVVDGPYWNTIVNFVRQTGANLVFDLSCLQLRTPTGAWDTSNTELMLQYIFAHNQTDAIYAFELGNEPAHFYYHHNQSSGPNATQLARDYRTLHQLLRTTYSQAGLAPPLIFGPDLCCNYTSYLDSFLATLGPGVLDALTVHSYPLQGIKNNNTGECNLTDFLNGTKLDRSNEALLKFKAAQAVYAPGTPIILGETATAGDGGCPGLSNSFAAGFFWVDQLGRAASLGYSRLFRQDLVGWSGQTTMSNYALTGPPGWVHGGNLQTAVHPDYFTTRIWQQVMGSSVLQVQPSLANLGSLRIYAACSANNSVALAYVNLENATATVNVRFVGAPMPSRRLEYVLTSAGALNASAVLLNGQALTTALQPLQPVSHSSASPLTLPAHSYGFILFPNINAEACL